MPIRRTIIFFALLLFAVPFGYYALLANSPEVVSGGSAGGNASNYQYYVVDSGDVVSVVSAVGTIEADEFLDLSFTTPGEVQEIFVAEGDYVMEGDLLLRLSNDDQRIAYDRAVLNLELAEIELADLLGPVDGDQVRIAQASVDAAWGNYRSSLYTASPADIEAADLRVSQAQAAYDAAMERRIYGGNFEDENDVSLADAQVGAASFNLEVARLQAEDLRTGNPNIANSAYQSYLQSLAELERVLAGPTDIQIDQAELRVTQAEAQLQSAELTLQKTELRAPTSGVVTDILVEPGALTASGTPAVKMVDVEPLSLTIQIDEIDIGRIQPNMDVLVEVDAISSLVLDATLEKIALTGVQSAGGIVNYDAEVELTETDNRIRVGMTAEANIIVDQETGVLVVPNAFIRLDRRNNQAFVQIVNESNELEEREIVLGLRGQEFSEVTSGLVAGDIIAADLTGNQFSLFGD